MEHWEFDVLNIYNWHKHGKLDPYFRNIERRLDQPGDICEAGVFQGRSLLATALFLRDKGSEKIVYGFDTFSGLPTFSHEDVDFTGISEDHRRDIEKLIAYRNGTPLSTSGNFEDCDPAEIHRKADLLGLNNYRLIQGPFDVTMKGDFEFVAALMDCDLYQSYKTALAFIWPRLIPGGYVFLDEYYSLKFPGPRKACDELIEARMHPRAPNDFERWYAEKPHVV